MRHIFFLFFLIFSSVMLSAQNFYSVNHLCGTEYISDNKVTVKPEGNPNSYMTGGVSPYWIGNNKRINCYKFLFEKPVYTIKIHISAINPGEIISIAINEKQYALEAVNISEYNSEHFNTKKAELENGKIVFNANYDEIAETEVTISNGAPIKSVQVSHMNAIRDGAIFDLAFSYDIISKSSAQAKDATVGSINGINKLISGTTGIEVYPNPNNGSFTLYGKLINDAVASIEVSDATGKIIYRGSAVPSNTELNTKVNLSELPNGIYVINVLQNGQLRSDHFTITR